MSDFLFTSESGPEGHPDNVADQISDAVLDAILKQDKSARVAAETLVKDNLVVLAGEITSNAQVSFDAVVRNTIRRIGYTDPAIGFDAASCTILIAYGQQSPDIARGVDQGNLDQGAGDQGMMFGYACDETPSLMPAPIWLAHRLAERMSTVRKDGTLPYLRPDGKTQVSIVYEGSRPRRVDTVLISSQHAPHVDIEGHMSDDLRRYVVEPTLALLPGLENEGYRFLVNPTGRFEKGGPHADTGLTGRKIIVDTYGGAARHGGGAFSGKDPSKVDRSAAYAARWVAKHVVASGAASRCEIQVAYAIGVARPVS